MAQGGREEGDYITSSPAGVTKKSHDSQVYMLSLRAARARAHGTSTRGRTWHERLKGGSADAACSNVRGGHACAKRYACVMSAQTHTCTRPVLGQLWCQRHQGHHGNNAIPYYTWGEALGGTDAPAQTRARGGGGVPCRGCLHCATCSGGDVRRCRARCR